MSDLYFEFRSRPAVPAAMLREWHFREGVFSRLTPPWESAEIVSGPQRLEDGARIVIKVGFGPFRRRWVARHEVDAEGFVDRQESGPFAAWEHRHCFLEDPERPGSSELVDAIRFRLPFGPPGRLAGEALVRRKLERLFRYRHEVARLDLERSASSPPPRALSILVSGATGMVGSVLCPYLRSQGHRVYRLTRTPSAPGDLFWDPEKGRIELPPSPRFDGVIHLAGESIAAGRWSARRKRRILESRRDGTLLLARALAALASPPEVLVSASGINRYAAGPGAPHGEDGPAGSGFLAEVCRLWEEGARPALEAGIRVVHPRIGLVLDPRGGALARLAPLFRSGLGGRIGHGRQRLSWIAIDDLLDLLHRSLFERTWEGAVNFTAPGIVSNEAFSTTLASVLRRPATLPVPAFALKAAFGEMAEETLLADLAVAPRSLVEAAYPFRYPDLRGALEHLFGACQGSAKP